ncbi:type I-E CRISPR-associated protein Cas5/CasD [Kitasatospora sp. NPDC058965]|uniref:type I-E CRISPR-associated protein Cas5/CasD n=1 Tax=Kitasatospora sp. NPDC058965 TaxID=3346682 RepID=UPI0036AC8495
MTGFLLRLAGPMQSWGERSPFNAQRDSAPFPTRSGLIGMFAAAEGLPRGADLGCYRQLEFTVRIDRPGVELVDYHTAGGGRPKHLTAATSAGDHKGEAVVTRRTYLADAVFVVAVSGPEPDITRIAAALQRPYWAPYLGRRSCVPDEPLLLRAHVEDPVDELRRRVPLSVNKPRHRRGQPVPETMPVDFLWESRQGQPTPGEVIVSINDNPNSFAQHGRGYSKRQITRTEEQLPTGLATEDDSAPLYQRLIAYAQNQEATA